MLVHGYMYALWDGKEAIGEYKLGWPLSFGIKSICIPILQSSPFKEKYDIDHKFEKIIVPVKLIHEQTKHNQYTTTLVLDVRRKSQRQIDLIKKYG